MAFEHFGSHIIGIFWETSRGNGADLQPRLDIEVALELDGILTPLLDKLFLRLPRGSAFSPPNKKGYATLALPDRTSWGATLDPTFSYALRVNEGIPVLWRVTISKEGIVRANWVAETWHTLNPTRRPLFLSERLRGAAPRREAKALGRLKEPITEYLTEGQVKRFQQAFPTNTVDLHHSLVRVGYTSNVHTFRRDYAHIVTNLCKK